jgi:hypothetical protein
MTEEKQDIDRWAEFDNILGEIGGPFLRSDGVIHTHEKHGDLIYHDLPVDVEHDFKAYILSLEGKVPSTLQDELPASFRCDTWDDMVSSIQRHACEHGTLVRYDEPKRLSCGWVCSQCGESWLLKLREYKKSQSSIKELLTLYSIDDRSVSEAFKSLQKEYRSLSEEEKGNL